MTLQWTEDLKKVISNAETYAQRMHVRLNTALLVRSMLRVSMPVQEIMSSLGITVDLYDEGLKTLPLQPEPFDAPQRIYDRAARISAMNRADAVSSIHMLFVMIEEACTARSLLRALHLDLTNLRTMLYSCMVPRQSIPAMQIVRSSSSYQPISLQPSPSNAVAVQCKSAILRPTTYIEQQPAVSYSSEDFRETVPQAEIKRTEPSNKRKPLMTPSEISQLPAAKSSETKRTSSAAYRSSLSREMQQSTTLELARRLQKLKKTESSEGRQTPPDAASKPEDLQVKTAETAVSNHLSAERSPGQASACGSDKSHISAAPVTAAGPEVRKISRAVSPIISRSNLTAVNDCGSVLARKSNTAFNPLDLRSGKFPVLCSCGRNLLAEALSGRIDPVINRDREIEQLVDVLNKRRSNNPILVGDPGVGKTAIVEGLAVLMARQKAPQGLEGRTIIALDYGSILCGTQLRGAVQERIKAIKTEVASAHGRIILFLDEIHNWFASATGDPNADASHELKLALSRGELLCIGASTPQELRRAFNADPAFERRFDFIEVKAPDPETSIRIISNGIIAQYETHHRVKYEQESIRQAVRLSERYIQDRALPDKAISVLDRAGSLCQRSGNDTVMPAHVAQVISLLAEVPIERLLVTEREKLLKMESILGKRLIGHDLNITRIANVIRRNHAGFGAQRPIGSFLFLGPTGVGKTETAKVLADYLFGSPKNIVRFDMSEFMEQHSVAKLIGAPAGYVGFDDGGLLTEALRKHPYQIVLFDEIEKAHPDIMNIMLQILDEGRLTDARGRHVSFSNTVVIMTSNLGAQEVAKLRQGAIGFAGEQQKISEQDADDLIIKTAKSKFSPELWNRIEEKLVFRPLTLEQIEKIAHLLLNDSRKRLLDEKNIDLSFDEISLIPFLINHGGYIPEYGARPMRKTIQSLVESQIAEWILSHSNKPHELYIGLKDNQIHVEEIKPVC